MGRFFRRGTSQIFFLPAISNKAAPSSGEFSAGDEITADISNMTGWDFANTPITTPDLSTTFDTQIGGPDTAGSPTIEFYDRDDSTTIRDALAKGTAGYLVRAPYGDTATNRCEVFPVKVTAINDAYTLGNDAAKFVVGFAVTAAPTLNAVMP